MNIIIDFIYNSLQRTTQIRDVEEEPTENTQEGIVYNLRADRVLISLLYRF